MKRAILIVAGFVRHAAGTLWLYALWTLWLALGACLAAQVYIGWKHEVSVPDFVLRQLEERLTQTGLRVTFERATFDPTGRILVRSPRVYLPGFADPVASASAAYVGLDPWSLAVGKLEVREIRLLNGAVYVSAMLSPSGRAEPIIGGIDALIAPREKQVHLRHVSAHLGRLELSVHGIAALGGRVARTPDNWVELLRSRYSSLCAMAVEVRRRLDTFEKPYLDVTLSPAQRRGTLVSLDFNSQGIELQQPVAAEVQRLRVRGQISMPAEPAAIARLQLEAGAVRLPGRGEANQVTAVAHVRLPQSGFRVEPVELEVVAGSIQTPDGPLETVSLEARPRSTMEWTGEGVARVLDSRIGYSGEADLEAETARLRIAGPVSPRILDVISARARVEVRRFFAFETAEVLRSVVEIGSGWKFQRAQADVTIGGIDAHGVRMDDGRATVFIDPTKLYSPEAYARIGPNFARGTYEHVFKTREFRFLLDGQLRPLDISGWFQDWWPHFFDRFAFPSAPPPASVDVHGYWREGRRTSVFVFADAKSPVILGQPLARVRTRLFLRPGFYDGLELFATHPETGSAEGTFAVSTNMDTSRWRSVDVNATSSMPLESAGRMLGEWAAPILAPFELSSAPDVKFVGHFEGPAVSGTRHNRVDLEARTRGAFGYYKFPLEDVSFKAQVRDDEITVDSIAARFAGGALRLHAKVWGQGAERRIGFDVGLRDASLGTAAALLQNFSAARKGLPPPPPGKFVQEKANVRIDVAAIADGLYSDPLSFNGGGSASLSGAEIGEVPLFGPLSELLKFTALRFTTAQTKFTVKGPKIEFPDFALRGANSAIDAHGEYALDRRQLDFRAKVFPFQESGGVIKAVVGAVLTPISSVLEVNLTGTLERPDWAFVYGPTSLLRSLAGDGQPDQPVAQRPAAASPGIPTEQPK